MDSNDTAKIHEKKSMFDDISNFTLDDDEEVERKFILDEDVIRAVRSKIRELDEYPMEETKTRHIIMLGRSGSGKSTACKVMKNITADQDKKNLFSETVDPRFTSFSLDDLTRKIKFTFNVIDTPGVQEVRPRGENARSDNAILDTVKYCLKNEITKIHVLFIFAAFEQRITPLDKQAFQIYLDMFYNENVKIAFCITRAEGRGREWRESIERDLKKDEFFGPVLERPNVELFFAGVVEQRTVRTTPDPKTLFRHYTEILNMRKKMINFIFEAPDKGVDLLKLPIVNTSRNQMAALFDMQFDILTKLESISDFDVGSVHSSVEMFVENLSYMMENEGILYDPEMFSMFAKMRARMKPVATKMPENLKVLFTSKVIL